MEAKERRYDVDWLRVIAFYLLIFFHAGMFFVPWQFHFKNPQTSEWFETWMAFLHYWRLPLLFMISGIGVSYALGKRSPLKFVGERFKRLFIPLIFGMLVIIPPQIYFERLTQGVHFGSYFDFWKTVFEFKPYPLGGALSWHHLWFILYILFYSLVGLPFFLFFRSKYAVGIRERISRFVMKHPNTIYTIMISLAFCYFYLRPMFPVTHGMFDDWYNHAESFIFFLSGYLFASIDGVWNVIVEQRKKSLIMGVVPALFLILFVWGPTLYIMNEKTEAFGLFYGTLIQFMVPGILFSVLGYGKILLNKPSRLLSYANESVYPLYILHQSVQLSIGYFILQLNWGILPKFILVVIGTFGLSLLIYELLIRRFNVMRLLFGLKFRSGVKQEKNIRETQPVFEEGR